MVEKLREEGLGYGIGPAIVCQEAADLIEQLVEALEVIEGGSRDVSNTAIIVGDGADIVMRQVSTALSAARGEARK